MFYFMRTVAPSLLLSAALALSPTLLAAQSSLGVAGFTAEVGVDDGRADAQALLDTAVTEFHGVQLDLSLTDYKDGAVGQIAGHLYMTPVDGQKYGLFGFLGDADERSRTYGAIGLEGMFSVMPNSVLEVSGGLGLADPDSWDFIYLDAGLSHMLGSGFRLDYGLTLTEIDEVSVSTVGSEARLGLRYSPTAANWGAFAEARYDEFDGDADTTFRFGITFNLGRGTGFAPKERMFRTADPLGPLFRRGLL
ncbi:MAG: hypothetical protein QNI90_11205 [Dinoroseobacter sp.]|nr:hypothetical protein [Dinoroseobacter sp.]